MNKRPFYESKFGESSTRRFVHSANRSFGESGYNQETCMDEWGHSRITNTNGIYKYLPKTITFSKFGKKYRIISSYRITEQLDKCSVYTLVKTHPSIV